ncbi:MAG TPA: LON peptidase substrate-binding domain-containing protein [Chthoniobacteraceae bacterium]|nr:LON peptidase substrate-binding domain-containing protein [Chthoniobacteraceae bacterium]
MKHIAHQKLNLPAEAPVMALPAASLFPTSLLPLHIFEKRYRAMLASCLESNRMFCVAQMKTGVEECHSVAGLGLIRASVENADGTSNLILQGLVRVRLTNFVQHKPYPIAQISELRSTVENPAEADALGAKLLEICRAAKHKSGDLQVLLNPQSLHIASPETISDFVAQAFVADGATRQRIMEELEVCERLRMLIACLREEGA